MSVIRRHLASLGLAVVLSQIVMQVLVPAALCCDRPTSANRVETADCCAAAHPGQLCPMHAAKRVKAQQSGNAKCHARPVSDLRDLVVAMLTGDLVPAPVSFVEPAGSDPAFQFVSLFAPLVSSAPPGPPPRV